MSANQKQELHMATMLWCKMRKSYRGPAIDVSYQFSVHLAMWFERSGFFRNRPHIKQKLPIGSMFVNGSGRN